MHVGSFRFQPGEFSKIFLIVFLAAYLREKREALAQARLKDVGPLLVIWGACMLVLVSSNDLGSGLLYFGIFLSMLYVATARLSFVVVGLGLFLAGGFLAYEKIPHVHERVTIWLHPWTSTKVFCPSTGGLALRQDCESYQLVKSLYSIANGGFGGTGLGKGTFTTTDGKQLIPYVNSDFIYSALAQELGLIGAAALLLVFMLFVARGMKIALQADDGFSKLLAAGLTFGFALQTFIIVGGVLRIIPLTGITLPFVSYGGSSVVANFLLLAGLLLVSNRRELLNEQADLPHRDRRLLLLASLIVATTYWQTWAPGSLAAKQDNAIQRVAQFRINRGKIYASDGKTVLAQNVKKKAGDQTLYYRTLPDARPRLAAVGYSTVGPLARRHRARGERVPDGRQRERRDDHREADRHAEGRDDPWQQPRAQHPRGRAEDRGDRVARKCGAAVVLNPKTGGST